VREMLGISIKSDISIRTLGIMHDRADHLLSLLVEFFDLPAHTKPADIEQRLLSDWDSLAMVQLITALEQAFSVNFEIDEIVRLTSYREIQKVLISRGVCIDKLSR
jgi:acyl carrier protein